MTVAKLIRNARTARTRIELNPSALRDLRQVLRFNATQPHKRRVTLSAFVQHLADEHDTQISEITLRRIVQSMGRTWT